MLQYWNWKCLESEELCLVNCIDVFSVNKIMFPYQYQMLGVSRTAMKFIEEVPTKSYLQTVESMKVQRVLVNWEVRLCAFRGPASPTPKPGSPSWSLEPGHRILG